MKNSQWAELKDDALETLLLERWLFRGVLLVLMMVAAIFTTYLGLEGPRTFLEQLAVGILVCIAFSAGVAIFVMRNTDIRIHRELRRRRRT